MKTKCPLPKRFSGTKRVSGILLGLLALALTAASVAGAAPFAYVSNLGSNSVSVIDGATNTIIVTVPVGAQPVGVAVNRDGTRVYVANSNLFGNGVPSLSVIDTSTIGTTNTPVVTSVTGVGTLPFGVAMNKEGTKVYVANMGDGTVAVIDPAKIGTPDNPVTTLIPTCRALSGFIAVNPTSGRVYVTDSGNINGSLVEVNGTCAEHKLVTVGSPNSSPQGLGVHPSGNFVYVANSDGTVSVIDTAKIGTPDNPVVNTVQIGSVALGLPFGIAVSENSVYATNQGEETVEIIAALPPNQFIASVPVGIDPYGVAIDPTGAFVFVGNSGAGSMSVIDTATNKVVCQPAQPQPCNATVTVASSLVFGSFVAGAPPTIPPPPPPIIQPPPPAPGPSCDPKITEPYAKLKMALKKNAVQARAAALRELEKAKAKVGGTDKRIVRAQKEFDAGAAALCIGHYRRAAHEYWEAYEIAHRIVGHDQHHRR